jgi:hypothetical protein
MACSETPTLRNWEEYFCIYVSTKPKPKSAVKKMTSLSFSATSVRESKKLFLSI